MLLFRSPSIIFSFICSLLSIVLIILLFDMIYNHPQQQTQLLIVLPPLNIIFSFLSSLIWTERRFRLSYVPLICLIILISSTSTLTFLSYSLLPLSILFYLNMIYYIFLTTILCLILLITIISSFYSSFSRNVDPNTVAVHEEANLSNDELSQFDKFTLKSNGKELLLFISKLPHNHRNFNINAIIDNLNQIEIDIILTLIETSKISQMNLSTSRHSSIDSYTIQMKQTNIEHITYPVNSRCIPKSISDYIQFLYWVILGFLYSDRKHLFINYIGDMERIGMTLVCFELLYEYITDENQQKKPQKFLERISHYPLLMDNHCRVCQSISNVRKIRPRSIHNPLQVLYVHEFYARLKSLSYMKDIKDIVNQKFITSNIEELQYPTNM